MTSPAVLLEAAQAHVEPQSLPTYEHQPEITPHTTTQMEALGKEDEKAAYHSDDHEAAVISAAGADEDVLPTEEESSTLRRVAAPIPWVAVAMCAVELAERASYYGCYQGPFQNFVQNPLPPGGNGAGAVAKGSAGTDQSAGALGLGSVDSTALSQTFKFLAYVVPLYTGVLADTKWGRWKTLCVGTAVGAVAHILLVISAVPPVLKHPNGGLAAFTISIIILAVGAGLIKPCVATILCDQSPVKIPVIRTTKKGERVILDPQVTVQRYLSIFYWCINLGAFFSLATTYSERFVGFWLAYLEPGIIYMLMPIVLVICYKRIYKAPPQGSVFLETCKVLRLLFADGGWKRMWKGGDDFWMRAKPSYIHERDGQIDIEKVFWDDKFVDEIKQTLRACAVFALIPIFNLADGGIGNQMNAMSTGMKLDGVPNDLLGTFNSIAIIVMAPVLNFGLYPLMARMGRPLLPMTRMAIGFFLGSITCILCAIVQWRIYKTSPCGWEASDCTDGVSTVSLWWQLPLYFIPAVGELFVILTSYEIAYTRSPARMKGLVYAVALLPSAIAAAVSLACSQAIQDPYLIWPYVALAVACFICAIICPTVFKDLDTWQSDFANKERQLGHQQPKYVKEHDGEGA